MTLNIKELVALADRLDKAGRRSEADKIDQLVQKLANTLELGNSTPVKDVDVPEGYKPRTMADDAIEKSIDSGMGRVKEETKSWLPERGPEEAPDGLDQQTMARLADQGWDIFPPGDLEKWLSAMGYVKVSELDLLSDEDFEEVNAKVKQRMLKSARDINLPEHVPGAFDLSSEDRVLPVEIEKDFETFLSEPTKDSGEIIINKIKEYLDQKAQQETQQSMSDEDTASEIERIEKEKGVVWSAKKKVFEKLAMVADRLDAAGAPEEANLIDGFIQKHAKSDDMEKKATDVERKEEADTEQSKRYDSKYHHSLQIREPKTDQERIDREGRDSHHVHSYQSTDVGALSTRYCPNHVGVMMSRVGESTYQCPLDGQTYNWETGWTDHDGNEHPGGSVAGQTPDSSGVATPHRIFDSRENILNRIN